MQCTIFMKLSIIIVQQVIILGINHACITQALYFFILAGNAELRQK